MKKNKQLNWMAGLMVLTMGVLSGWPVQGGDLDPAAGPAPTMHTLKEIYDKIMEHHQFLESIYPTKTLSATSTAVEEGFYQATTLEAVEPDLSAGNIKEGVKVFGILGTHAGGVPKTGQTTCYLVSNNVGVSSPCPADGLPSQDGDLQKGVAWPVPRFTDNGNGTVTDNMTKLIWLKQANCFAPQSWANALSSANTLNSGECGLSDGSVEGDWRLPNVREMQSILHYGVSSPAVPNTAGTGRATPGDPFTGIQLLSYYWTSSTYTWDAIYAWQVRVDVGRVNADPKTFANWAWPVRGGQ